MDDNHGTLTMKRSEWEEFVKYLSPKKRPKRKKRSTGKRKACRPR